MKLTLEGLKEKTAWEKAGVCLPSYDIEKTAEETKRLPYGCILELETFFVFLSAVWRTR